MFVANPTWLDEAYKDAINRSDIGLVYRSNLSAAVTKSVLELCLRQPTARCVDYGAGYGLLVRQMRDLGYDFVGFDPYCENLFARDFAVGALEGKYALATSFEVFEHLTDPFKILDAVFEHCDSLLLSTELFPATRPQPSEWWYYGLDHGQHVSFYTHRALELIARRYSKCLCSIGCSFHLLASRPVTQFRYRLARSQRFARLFVGLHQRPSLLMRDHAQVTRAATSHQ